MSGANPIDTREGHLSRFLALTDRIAFCEYWGRLAATRGASLEGCASLAEADSRRETGPIALLIIDTAYMSAMQVLRAAGLSAWRKESRIILAGAPCSVDEELAALAAGVAGCCAPELGTDELGTVIDVVLKGGIWVSRQTLPLLLSRLQDGAKAEGFAPSAAPAGPAGPERAWSTLTRREREIALHVAEGSSNKVIAGVFDLSDATVKAHLTSIYQKLGVSSRLQLALLLSGMLRRRPELAENG